MNKLFVTIICNCLFFVVIAQPKWLRYPAISPNGLTIAFTYKGNIYTVPVKGGKATQITFHEAHDFMPVWSNDSKTLAFASDRYGNFDIYTVSLQDGTVKRLTYHSAPEYPYSFSPDDKQILFGASRMDAINNRQFPTGYMTELYAINATGGRPVQILTTPAEEAKYSSDGKFIIYQDKKGGENTWRKHHTSSVTKDIWLYNVATKEHQQLTNFNGEDRNPVFAGNNQSFYYLSEESGSFNIHLKNNNGNTVQLTNYKKHPVRFLSKSNNNILCFGYDGEIYTIENNQQPVKVNITIVAEPTANTEQVVRVTSGSLQAVSPNGKEIAFIYKGDVFVTAIDGGITKQITKTPEQESAVSFNNDGKKIIYGSERNGTWGIYETEKVRTEEPYFYASTLLKETPLLVDENINTQPLYSNDGKELAFIKNRSNLCVYNFSTKKVRTLLTDKQLFAWGENDQYFKWSPDNKWLLFNYAYPGNATGEIGIVSADGKEIKNLTQSGFNDYNAQWILEGKAMIWQSNRDGLRAAAMSGGSQSDVFALFFTKDAYDKFRLSKEEYALLKDTQELALKTDTLRKKNMPKDSVLVIEWNNIENRKLKLTIHSSSLGSYLVSKDGETLYYLARFEKGYNLWTTNLRTKETKMLVPLNAGFATMMWDKDQKNIFISANGSISKLEPSTGKQERITIDGEMLVDVEKTKAYMFNHVWRKTKATFYTQSFHGVNWDSYKPDYEAYLPHIGNNYEFSEMLSELLGELNVSHSGSSYFAFQSNADATASLGAFYNTQYTGNGVQIAEILKDGPLDRADLNIAIGDIIESIDGELITPDKDLAQYLNRKAGKSVLLGITSVKGNQLIVVKPISLGEENSLLYKRWIKRNEEEVEKLSNGTLGYVHIPGMSDGAYRDTYEDIMGKFFDKKGIVVDTRNNGGGDLVADLAMFFSGKKFMDYATDTRSTGFEPNFRWTKPSIHLANEANYSDGHCYAYMVKQVNIGKLVGMPVPGTCTFAGWESLMDTGIRWGVPSVGCKDVNGKYLENAQTEPDIKVMNEYKTVANGTDKQLEIAVQELLKQVK